MCVGCAFTFFFFITNDAVLIVLMYVCVFLSKIDWKVYLYSSDIGVPFVTLVFLFWCLNVRRMWY